ncbi:MAG TPA: hypothetical protein VNT75_02435 [Symbiobacteriaceae bacterium]|nr:hypothetical protein [Symbiobacteriaceae bacterium]
MAYYTSSYIFNNSTTSTAALMIWRAISGAMEHKQMPMTGDELVEASGVSIEYIDSLFNQSYYQRFYGFRRFQSLDEFQTWAMSTGVLYNPELHDPKPEEIDVEELAEEDEDETEE